MFRSTRLASFQLNRKDVASISSRVLRESFEKLGREQKEEFGEGVERKEGGACFKEIKVNFANVDKRRFSNKPNREISRGVLQNRGVCGLQPRTKLLRHFNAIFNFAPCNLRVQKEQIRPPPHPCCNVVLA